MNTVHELPHNDDFFRIEAGAVPTKVDETAAALEAQLQRERDKRNEERFIWIFVSSLLAYPSVIDSLGTWTTISFTVLWLIFLIAAAKWLGVDTVVVLLERIVERLLGEFKNKQE